MVIFSLHKSMALKLSYLFNFIHLGHIICKPCSNRLSTKSKKLLLECPICRKELTIKTIHDIYI